MAAEKPTCTHPARCISCNWCGFRAIIVYTCQPTDESKKGSALAAPLIDQEIPFKFEQDRRQVMILSRGKMNPTYGAIALCDRTVVRDIFAMCDWIRERGLVQL